MGNIFRRRRAYWVPVSRRICDKIARPDNWKISEDFTGWQIQNDPKGIDLFAKFENCDWLIEVNLSFNGLGDDECAALAKALRNSKTLKRLDLSNNHIHAAGAQKLSMALTPSSGQDDPTLEELNLRNNSVGADGALILATILSCNKTIKKLNLYWNNIRNRGLEAICNNLRAAPLPPDYRVDVRFNGFELGDVTVDWEQMKDKLTKSKLEYLDEVPESERRFLGWPAM